MNRNNEITDRRLTRTVLMLLLGITVLPSVAQALESYTISGTITAREAPHPPLEGVSVKVFKGTTSTVVAQTQTNSSGEYSVSVSVDPGVDDHRIVVFTKAGRQPANQPYNPLDEDKTLSGGLSLALSDPPNNPDDYIDTNSQMQLPYKRDGANDTAVANQCMIRIYNDNPNFAAAHACCDYTKATSEDVDDQLAGRVSHVHYRYNYGSGPSGDDDWPTAAEGKAYWDAQFNMCPAGGSATTVTNCVCYAFDGLNNDNIRVEYWVDSAGFGEWAPMDKLWGALPTSVYDGSGSFEDCEGIKDGDVAGTDEHVWVLHDPSCESAAQRITFECAASGEYEWHHPGTFTNKAPDGAGGWITDGKIKREEESSP